MGTGVTRAVDPSGLYEWGEVWDELDDILRCAGLWPFDDPSSAAAKTPIPRVDRSGKLHDGLNRELPRKIPKDWGRPEIQDALEEVEESLRNRQRENIDHGRERRRPTREAPTHRGRVKREIDWRNLLRDALRMEPHEASAGMMMTIGTGLMAFGATGTLALVADDVTVVGVADDVLIIGTGGAFFIGGAIVWVAGGE